MADLERTAWVAYYRRRWLRLAVAADDFEHVGVPALWPALHDAERLAPQDHRPAMAGPVQGLHACRLRRLCLRSVIVRGPRHAVQVGHFEPEANDPLHEPGKGWLIGKIDTKGCRAP